MSVHDPILSSTSSKIMPSISSDLKSRTWYRTGFTISTDHKLIPLGKLSDAISSPAFYWAKEIPLPALEEMLKQSLCFGLFRTRVRGAETEDTLVTNSPQSMSAFEEKDLERSINQQPAKSEESFIGFARCITDFATFSYLTDVWVDPMFQGQGLGKWLVTCVRTCVESMPHLRRSMLLTGDWERSVPFYKQLMDMTLLGGKEGTGLAIMEWKGPGHPESGIASNSSNQ